MNFPKPILLGETASTNTYLAERCNLERLPELTSVYTSYQTAGRGQRGNSWNRKPELTFCSALLYSPTS